MDNKAYIQDSEELPKNGSLNGPAYKDNVVAKQVEIEEDDPWKVTSIKGNYTPWSELNSKQKSYRLLGYIIKIVLVIGCLYMFICSLDFLSSAFKLLGGEAAGRVLQRNDLMTNPLAGVMMGVMVTVLVQSSSTSTSIVVSMVGADILSIKTAIPMVMGANIGTSVTNTIVALGQISDQGEFRRAFAGATVHDMFNWLSVCILLPIEIATGMLYHLTKVIVDSLNIETNPKAKKDILKVITKPFTEKIVQINKDAITAISKDQEPELESDHIILKLCCDKTPPLKCCRSIKEDHSSKFIHPYINQRFRQDFCGKINTCVDKLDTIPTNCVTKPWTFTPQHFENRDTLTCDRFSNVMSEINCCVSAYDDQEFFKKSEAIPQSKREEFCGMPSLSQCFNNATSNFTYATCIESDSWVKVNLSILGQENFDCLDWVKSSANTTCNSECDYLFSKLYPDLNDIEIGAILLVIALFILCCCLVLIVKLLHSLLQGPMAVVIKKFVNADFPGPLAYLTGYIAILIGAGITIVVQSSSIFTSSITPLVGIGVIEIDRMYPLTLGSNIGTTTTSILSALANSGEKLQNSLQVAFAHLFFNIFGILIFYPFPFFRPPIPLAKFLGTRTAKYRWFAVVYIILIFFLFPLFVFALSVAGWYVLGAVLIPIAVLAITVIIIKTIQNKRPQILPNKLRDWKFLPAGLRSLEPYDNIMRKVFRCKRFRRDSNDEHFDEVVKTTDKGNSHIISTRV